MKALYLFFIGITSLILQYHISKEGKSAISSVMYFKLQQMSQKAWDMFCADLSFYTNGVIELWMPVIRTIPFDMMRFTQTMDIVSSVPETSLLGA